MSLVGFGRLVKSREPSCFVRLVGWFCVACRWLVVSVCLLAFVAFNLATHVLAYRYFHAFLSSDQLFED